MVLISFCVPSLFITPTVCTLREAGEDGEAEDGNREGNGGMTKETKRATKEKTKGGGTG